MKPESRYNELTRARKILGIPEEVTLDEIKHTFRDIVRHWHPDKSHGDNGKHQRKTRKIIESYRIIMKYCREYKISFSKENVDNYRPAEELWWEQFGNDPLWGPMKKG